MIRTRMAPSPTGYLHFGTARTALFNYLFAKKHGGRFVLRIEDTDRERSEPAFERDIIDGLAWLGIQWDEGPDVGGAQGPYRQSERIEIYKKYLNEMARQDLIYSCFCTAEELERERELQTLAKQPPRYSGKCRTLSDAERRTFTEQGRASTLRFKMPQEVVTIADLIRGDVTFDTATLDDIIIAKNSDTPLYNFAVVVDDALMRITHVIRGEDHISNTPKQILLARALGFDQIPQFGHLPLILNADRTKLSKRQNKVSLIEYRRDGYLPEALINFMVLLGWSPEGDRELFSLTELEEVFDLSRVHKAGAVFNNEKLDWFNAQYIRETPLSRLAELCTPYLVEAKKINANDDGTYTIASTGRIITLHELQRMIALEHQRMKKLSDVSMTLSYLFCDLPAYDPALLVWKDMGTDAVRACLSFSRDVIRALNEEWSAESLEGRLKNALKDEGRKNGEVLWPLRVALTGLSASPSPFDVAAVLGKEQTLRRIDYAHALLNTQ